VIGEEVGHLVREIDDDSDDCPECQGSGDCPECDEDGSDVNTGEECDNCGGTHECPSCMGSGEADDDGHDTGEDESALEDEAAVTRLETLASSLGYKFEAPYTWGIDDDTGEEFESGAVRFNAAVTDDYGDWVIGLGGDGELVLHTVDDDISLTFDELDDLLTKTQVVDLLEMPTDEINGLLGR